MDSQEYVKYITKAFADNGLAHAIDERGALLLHQLSDYLVEANKTTNLTAITDEKDIILKHFIDCATVCDHLPQGAKILDVGCGAGFPSLPIAILRSDVSVTSIDSTSKKINFVSATAEKLGLDNVKAICCRAEEYAKNEREKFDVCVSRAVARLNVLSELCIPFVKVGGTFIAMKSEKGLEESDEASSGIKKLGGALKERIEIDLSSEDNKIRRELHVIQKLSPTPLIYPRNYSQITKKPL